MPAIATTLTDLAVPLLQVPILFSSAQTSIASHRKHINSLHAIFLRAASVSTLSDDGASMKLVGEKAFVDAFRGALVYPLGVKKGVEQADRIIKFVAGFLKFAVDLERKQSEDTEDEEEDGPSSRLVNNTFAFCLKGFGAKNKIARFRCVQLVSLMVSTLEDLDEDTSEALEQALVERCRDKEAAVRLQAVVALSSFQDAGNPEDAVTETLLDVLTHDSAADVRRATLVNLVATPVTLPALILRTLDVDPINRRLTYTHVLFELPCLLLSAEQRVEVLSRGLRDREEVVRRAAQKLVGKWAEDVNVGGLVKFVELFEIYENETTEKILSAIFEVRPDMIEQVDLTANLYADLTPQTAYVARNYYAYLRALSDPRLADLEPVLSDIAQYIMDQWTNLSVELEGDERDEEKESTLEFVVGELVAIAINVDDADEIGRRKMFEVMRSMLSHPSLPNSLIPRCLDVLLKETSEREFMRIVVEIVQQLRDASTLITSDEGEQADDEEPEEFAARKEQAKGKRAEVRGASPTYFGRRKELDLKCLLVVRSMLERVTGALQNNSMVQGLVIELIVPAVKTKDVEVRAAGLRCLGLACLLDKKMAVDSFELLARQTDAMGGELRVKLLQTLFDILILHGINFGENRDPNDGASFDSGLILGFLVHSLEQEEDAAIATSVVGITKLVISGMVTDEEIISSLVELYFSVDTADNQELRQCLSYFFPVYCYSNPANQRRIGNILLSSLLSLKTMYDDSQKGATVTPLLMGSQLLEWTDPQKAIQSEKAALDETIHFDLAVQMIKSLYESEQKDERKLLCQLLPKLYIPDEIDDLKIKALLTLISTLKAKQPLSDAVSKNALARFETALLKTFGARIDAITAEQLAESIEMQEVKAFLGGDLDSDDLVEDDEEDEEEESDEEDEEDENEATVVAVPRAKIQVEKEGEVEEDEMMEEDEDGEEEEEEEDEDE